MSGPPNDVEASELWLRLNEVPKPSEVIDFPRRDLKGASIGKMRIQVLTMAEHDEARIKAHAWLKSKGAAPGDFGGEALKEVLGDAVARELLALACVSEDPIKGSEERNQPRYARIFKSGADLQKLTADELMTVFTAWEMTQHKFGPFEGSIESQEEVTAWIKRLVEGASAYPLVRRNWHQLAELVRFLSERSYCLSAILDSQFSTLPHTLASDLAKWDIGTGSFGKRHAIGILPGLASSEEELIEAQITVEERQDVRDSLSETHPLHRPSPAEPITIEEAATLAKKLHSDGDP